MFSWFQKKSTTHTLAGLTTDLHAHLLPGLDDGPPSLNKSLLLIRGLQALGYTRLFATPHIYHEFYPNTPETILPALDTVRQALLRENIDVQIDAAAEYYVDEHFEALLDSKAALLTLPGRHILIEQSFFAPAPQLQRVIFELQTRGYRPILAHPERYGFYHGRGFDKLEALHESGVRFQLNLPSLAEAYGKPAREQALRLLKAGLVDFLGTDMHNQEHLHQLQRMVADGVVQEVVERHGLTNAALFEVNESAKN